MGSQPVPMGHKCSQLQRGRFPLTKLDQARQGALVGSPQRPTEPLSRRPGGENRTDVSTLSDAHPWLQTGLPSPTLTALLEGCLTQRCLEAAPQPNPSA